MITKKIFIIALLTISLITISIGPLNSTKTFSQAIYTKNTADQCSTPTMSVSISTHTGFTYNVTSLSFPLNTCVKITFANFDTVPHTFTIEQNSVDNILYFNIYASPGTQASSNFMTSKLNSQVKFYCQIPGHEAAGEYGTLTIGHLTTQQNNGTQIFSTVALVLIIVLILIAIYEIVVKTKSSKNSSAGTNNNNYYTSKSRPNVNTAHNKSRNCLNCQQPVLFDDVFCPNCGKRL